MMCLVVMLPLRLLQIFLNFRDLEAQLFIYFHFLVRGPFDHGLPQLVDVLCLNSKHLALIVEQQPPEPVA